MLSSSTPQEVKMPRILIVDDEKNILNLYKETFTEEGYEVVLAETGAECLEKVKKEHFDLVILDIRLPDMDGMEVLGKLSKGKKVPPVILNSAFAGYEGNPSSWLAEAYLIKSGDMAELKSKVKEITRRKC